MKHPDTRLGQFLLGLIFDPSNPNSVWTQEDDITEHKLKTLNLEELLKKSNGGIEYFKLKNKKGVNK
ncbi:MAG: hypothetical protein ACFE91_07175 [Promethearchaeota archaeon]